MAIGITSGALALMAAGSVVAIFFCGVEKAPIDAREMAKASRFAGRLNPVKMVRFW